MKDVVYVGFLFLITLGFWLFSEISRLRRREAQKRRRPE